jgi:hypothetical protein
MTRPTACSLALLTAAATFQGCATPPPPAPSSPFPAILADPATPKPPFAFNPDDDRLLDEITRGSFNTLWREVNPTGMVPDRTSQPNLVSVAGVGFQLSAFVVGVERGWVTKDAARERTLRILRALEANPVNRRYGMYYHFISGVDAGVPENVPEDAVSTIDSALLFAGILTVGQYFGGEVRDLGDRMVAGADWTKFILNEPAPEFERGFIALAWIPDNPADRAGTGRLKPYAWVDAGDEHRLVTFLAVASPEPKHRVDPALYYRLRRPLGTHKGEPMVYLPWSGAHFVNFFAHCWIDHARLGSDDPAAFGQTARARVDWWENGRRQTILHRDKAIAASARLPNLGPNSWGLTASDCPKGYCVPGVYPTPLRLAAERPDWDHPRFEPKDDLGDGTISPYGAVCSVIFEPDLALAAARHMKGLQIPGTRPVWTDPATGGDGFADAYNTQKRWISADHLSIDQGPMCLLVENARTGLVWRQFMAHPVVVEGGRRLGWKIDAR